MNITDFWLDPVYLNDIANKYGALYRQATPVPHIIIDDFLPELLLDKVLEEFPDGKSIDWKRFDAPTEKKLGSTSELQMGDITRFLLYRYKLI